MKLLKVMATGPSGSAMRLPPFDGEGWNGVLHALGIVCPHDAALGLDPRTSSNTRCVVSGPRIKSEGSALGMGCYPPFEPCSLKSLRRRDLPLSGRYKLSWPRHLKSLHRSDLPYRANAEPIG